MLRSAATPQGPTTRGSSVIIETNHPHTDSGEPGRTVDHHEPELNFELAEAPTITSNTRLISPSNDDLAFSTGLSQQQQQHQRQQTAPSFAPLRSRTPQSTAGTPKNRPQSQVMALTGDSRAARRSQRSPARAASRLGDTSPPVKSAAAAPDTIPASKQGGAPPKSTTPSSATPSRTGFLASLTTRLTGQAQQTPLIEDVAELDVEAALFPSSNPSDRDAFSPAAFKNLQTNAVSLLHKMQDAYRRQAATIREFEAEREAQKEEMEETELRIKHFKNQLENMAAKAAEQEKTMQQLVAELHAERKARAEERIAREKLLPAEGSVVSEDLGVDELEERKKWRKSDGTFRSDLSTDTDAESAESASIFSRCRSPTTTTTATTASTITETDCAADITSTTTTTIAAAATPPSLPPSQPSTPKTVPNLVVPKPARASQQMSTLQRFFVRGSAEAKKPLSPPEDCQNCRGQDSSVAWDTVSLLRDENRGLKHRVAELEVAVEGALDVVDGIGL
ncbi:hypothetical protein F4809DRAFT_136615 [Biscogniauxia mediterranea]|nr:hypothetical protein F4809DRAFT_136615 [Biscogniauxia mediterranea]